MIKVLIVDDQTLMRDGLKIIIQNEPDMQVTGTASSGKEAVSMMQSCKADLVLMDIRMKDMNGVQCTKILKEKYPDVVVLLLTTFNDEEYIMDALKYKAGGYLLKDIDGKKLVESIRFAAAGNLIMPQNVADKLYKSIDSKDNVSKSDDINLSKLEKDIANLMVQGYTNKQIASVLHISYGTVKNYVSQIYSKLDANDRVNAVMKLKEMNI